jgi:hypothetical protein
MCLQSEMTSGPAHHRWKGGKRINQYGYVQFTAGEFRFKLEHRVVVETLSGPLALNRKLRDDEEVHHIDFRRSHNCPINLLLLDKVIHDAISGKHGFWMAQNKRRKKK